MRTALLCALLIWATPCASDTFSTSGVTRTGPLAPGDTLRIVSSRSDTTLWGFVSPAGYFVQPVLRSFTCTAPTLLDVRGNGDQGGPAQAHSALYVVLYAALRKPRWDAPLVVVALDSTGYVEPGSQVTLSTAFRDTGATFFVRSRNMGGYSCWSNLVGP